MFLSEICWRSGVPIEGEQEGESRPFRGRKGQVFPACEPRERVTPEALKRRDNGFPLIKTSSERKGIWSPHFQTLKQRGKVLPEKGIVSLFQLWYGG